MLEQGRALALAEDFCRAYMGERDLERTLALVSGDVAFWGTGAHEQAWGREEFREYLRQDLAESPGAFRLCFQGGRETPAGDGCAVADLEVGISSETFRLQLQMSAVIRETAEGPQICHVRYAIPSALKQEGEHYPLALVEENINRMKSELVDKSTAGGVMGGYIAPGFPFYCINERMLQYLGYASEAEFVSDNRGLISMCMHPDDRAQVDAEVEKQLAGGDEYTVEYRMRRQDGSYIWVHDVGKAIRAEDGRPAIISVCMDITALKETERELEESRRRYELAVEGAGLHVWEYDIQSHRVYQGEKEAEFHGQGPIVEDVPEAMIRAGMVREDCIPGIRDLYRRLEAGESRVSGEYWLRVPGREAERCERITYVAAAPEGGRPTRAYGASMDVTRRKEAERRYEEELRYREEEASALLSSCRVNLTTRTVEEQYHRGELRREFPYDEIFRRASNRQIADPAVAAEVYAAMAPDCLVEAYDKGQRTLRQEYRIWMDGMVVWAVTTVNLMQRPGSNDILAFFYTKDATREKLLESAVDTIIESDYEFIFHVDAERGAYRVVASRPDQHVQLRAAGRYDGMVEAYLRRFAVAENSEALVRAVRLEAVTRNLEKDASYSVECDIREPDGSVRRKQMRFAYTGGDTRSILVTRKDIEGIVQAEKQKQEALRAALQAAREANSAKSEFMARMSHDMRTPLNGVIGLSQLGREAETLADARDYFEKISESGEYLLLLINDTLEMNRIESGRLELHPEPLFSRKLFEDIVAINRYAAQKRQLDFVAQYEGSGIWVWADRERTMQIFNNLLSNAIKFTPQGGRVEFLCRCGGTGPDGRRQSRVVVRDTGIGIGKGFLPKLFTPFEQENDSTVTENTGSGLGLSIVKRLVELMDGEITVESEKGRGTEFQVQLFFAPAEKPPKTPADSGAAEKDLRGRRVLLCEDHPLNAQIAVGLLERQGILVEWVENGRLGVERFAASPPGAYDAVLMDIRMPVMDGLDAARAIRSLDRPDAAAVPIIAMTANAFAADRDKSLKVGMNDHLAKPVNPQVLYSTLRRWLT